MPIILQSSNSRKQVGLLHKQYVAHAADVLPVLEHENLLAVVSGLFPDSHRYFYFSVECFKLIAGRKIKTMDYKWLRGVTTSQYTGFASLQ